MLYKARADGLFDYQGDDPTDYSTLYQQLYASGEANSDLTQIVARAKSAGDTGAGTSATKISQQLKQISATAQS